MFAFSSVCGSPVNAEACRSDEGWVAPARTLVRDWRLMEPIYDTIGVDYGAHRAPDPSIARHIEEHLEGLTSLVNVGAGTGSYEPADRSVTAVEPSWAMIRQRPDNAAPCVCAIAESLPFADNSFDGAMALLTVHHWGDLSEGLRELTRVARTRLLIYTWDPDQASAYWLINDYLPEIMELDRGRFLTTDKMLAMFSDARAFPVPIPKYCRDGFLGAYWDRPKAYLDPAVARGISSFQQIDQRDLARGLTNLERDLESGAWQKRYAHALDRPALDLGYRLIVAEL